MERKWRKTRNVIDHESYLEQCAKVNRMILDSKTEHFNVTLTNADAKTIHRTLNSLLNSSVPKFPVCASNSTLSNQFAQYFDSKVSKIRSELDSQCVVQSDNICVTPSESLLGNSIDCNIIVKMSEVPVSSTDNRELSF